MGDLMDQAIASLQQIAPEHRDEIASLVMDFVGEPRATFDVIAEDRAAIDEAEAEFERGEIATDDEIRAIWAKHGL